VASILRAFDILIVDDDPIACEIARTALVARGHRVRARTVALGTLADIRTDMPDVLLLDLCMPALRGEKLLMLVRWIFPRVKVVVYTGASKSQLPAEVREADLVVKKGTPDELVQRLEELRLR
jgi:CheY-like chemotaxis protein